MIAGDVLYLDVDGPLLDVAPRYHALHRELVSALGGTPLPRARYWALKRDRRPEREILLEAGIEPAACEEVERQRLARIETEAMLVHDRAWPWTVPALAELARRATLVLVTQRRSEALARAQLGRLGVMPHVAALVTGRGDDTTVAKAALLRAAGKLPGGRAAFVGDTEVDLESAHALGIPALAVRSGIRSDEHLRRHRPDAVLDDLRGVSPWLSERGWSPRS